MSRCIDADALKEILKEHLRWIDNTLNIGDFRKGCYAATQDIISTIDLMPTVETAAIAHAGESKQVKSVCRITNLPCSDCQPVCGSRAEKGEHNG